MTTSPAVNFDGEFQEADAGQALPKFRARQALVLKLLQDYHTCRNATDCHRRTNYAHVSESSARDPARLNADSVLRPAPGTRANLGVQFQRVALMQAEFDRLKANEAAQQAEIERLSR